MRFGQHDVIMRDKGGFERLKHARIALKPCENLPDLSDGVVVKPGPDMQPMFFDALALSGIPATCALATQPPAQLIHGNVQPFIGTRT